MAGEFQIQGLDRVRFKFVELQGGLRDPRPIWRRIAPDLRRHLGDRVGQLGLVRSGGLKKSFGSKRKGHVERASKQRLEIGSKHPLARLHQRSRGRVRRVRGRRGRYEGASRGRLRRSDIVGLQQNERQRLILAPAINYLLRAFRRGGA